MLPEQAGVQHLQIGKSRQGLTFLCSPKPFHVLLVIFNKIIWDTLAGIKSNISFCLKDCHLNNTTPQLDISIIPGKIKVDNHTTFSDVRNIKVLFGSQPTFDKTLLRRKIKIMRTMDGHLLGLTILATRPMVGLGLQNFQSHLFRIYRNYILAAHSFSEVTQC